MEAPQNGCVCDGKSQQKRISSRKPPYVLSFSHVSSFVSSFSHSQVAQLPRLPSHQPSYGSNHSRLLIQNSTARSIRVEVRALRQSICKKYIYEQFMNTYYMYRYIYIYIHIYIHICIYNLHTYINVYILCFGFPCRRVLVQYIYSIYSEILMRY